MSDSWSRGKMFGPKTQWQWVRGWECTHFPPRGLVDKAPVSTFMTGRGFEAG